jgi:hypothetical protein
LAGTACPQVIHRSVKFRRTTGQALRSMIRMSIMDADFGLD